MKEINNQVEQLAEILKGLLVLCVQEQQNQEEVTTNELPAKFYTINDVAKLTGFGEAKVRDLFHDPEFPSCDYGKSLIVEESALKEYFSKRREKMKSPYWRSFNK